MQPIPILLIVCFGMLALTAAGGLVARRLRVQQAILLVAFGAIIAWVPGAPRITLNPELVLTLLLPPVIYSAGVGMSWRSFRRDLWEISLLSVGCVLATASIVAAGAHWILNLPWSAGFMLGAVVSPPDPVAPMAIASGLQVPRRLLNILEGEGLVNDATALILFSLALNAATTGSFSVSAAAISFVAIVVLEMLWGVLVAASLLRLRAWAQYPEIEIVIALLTPFVAFWGPHFLGGSGVLATVAAGLYTSWNGPRLISPQTRLQGFFVWSLVVFVIQGVVFALTGLQARIVFEKPSGTDWSHLLGSAALTVLAILAVRFAWVFAATYAQAFFRRLRNEQAARPSWQQTFLIAFTGIRGVVSLVAALSIPPLVNGEEYAPRIIILFIAFAVIVLTLIGQGAALPRVIRLLGLDRAGRHEAAESKREELAARIAAIDSALSVLDHMGLPETTASSPLHVFHTARRSHYAQTFDTKREGQPVKDSAQLQLQLIEAERKSIAGSYAKSRLDDEARRRIERELDLEDARLRHAAESGTDPELLEPS